MPQIRHYHPPQTTERDLWLGEIHFERVKEKGRRSFYRDAERKLFKILVPVSEVSKQRNWLLLGPDNIVRTYSGGISGRYKALRFAAWWLKRRYPK